MDKSIRTPARKHPLPPPPDLYTLAPQRARTIDAAPSIFRPFVRPSVFSYPPSIFDLFNRHAGLYTLQRDLSRDADVFPFDSRRIASPIDQSRRVSPSSLFCHPPTLSFSRTPPGTTRIYWLNSWWSNWSRHSKRAPSLKKKKSAANQREWDKCTLDRNEIRRLESSSSTQLPAGHFFFLHTSKRSCQLSQLDVPAVFHPIIHLRNRSFLHQLLMKRPELFDFLFYIQIIEMALRQERESWKRN